MLSFPEDKRFGERVAVELRNIEKTCPNVMKWLKNEEQRLHKKNIRAVGDTFCWNQGGLQMLDSLFKHVREARDIYDRITKGD